MCVAHDHQFDFGPVGQNLPRRVDLALSHLFFVFCWQRLFSQSAGKHVDEFHSEVGVDRSKHGLRELEAGYRMQQSGQKTPLYQTVAVRHVGIPTGDSQVHRPAVKVGSDLFRPEIQSPAIVISADDGYLWSPIHEAGNRLDRPERSPRDYRPVLEPELEQIAVDKEMIPNFWDFFQKIVEL